MYAVIKTGGKQYRVASGEKIKVEQIAADVGQEIVFDQVLAVGNGSEIKVGTPLVSGANVKGTVSSSPNCKSALLRHKGHRSWHRKKAAALREMGAIPSQKCLVSRRSVVNW